MIVTIGSILTPSLLSIQMTEHVQNNYEIEINISVWIISVFVSISNGIVNLFKLDELFASCALTCEKLKTLWYKYITLSEPFCGTHDSCFNLFIEKMEEIIIEQKFQEFVESKSNKNKPKNDEDEFYNSLLLQQRHKQSESEPSISEPSISEPSIPEPSITEPSITEPSITEPSITEPSITEPSITEPSIENPEITQ